MLHKPDAAYLTQAGRGFLQVGSDEVYEQFQSGWSGAVYDEDSAGNKQVLARMLGNTGKTALVGNYAKRLRKEQRLAAWLERLLDCLHEIWEDQPELKAEQGSETTLYNALFALLRSAAFPTVTTSTTGAFLAIWSVWPARRRDGPGRWPGSWSRRRPSA